MSGREGRNGKPGEGAVDGEMKSTVFPPGDPDGSKARAELEKNLGLNAPCFVGLDMSLTSSGVAVKRGGEIIADTIKTTPRTCVNDLARLRYIVDKAMERIPRGVGMVGIEDVFVPMGSHQMGAALNLAMLGAVMRLALYEAECPFYIIAPSQLKKHVLGTGAGKKDMIVREVYKRYSLDVKSNDEADAVVLCCMAEHIFQTLNGGDLSGLPKYQREVIKTVVAERPSYNC